MRKEEGYKVRPAMLEGVVNLRKERLASKTARAKKENSRVTTIATYIGKIRF